MGDEEASAAKAREIARAILRYLEAYPDSKDTLRGIAQWWLWRELAEQRLENVERAVATLLSERLILETRRQGLPPYYGANPQWRKAISRILSRLEGRLPRE